MWGIGQIRDCFGTNLQVLQVCPAPCRRQRHVDTAFKGGGGSAVGIAERARANLFVELPAHMRLYALHGLMCSWRAPAVVCVHPTRQHRTSTTATGDE